MKPTFHFILILLFSGFQLAAQTTPAANEINYDLSKVRFTKLSTQDVGPFQGGTLSGTIQDRNGAPLVHAYVVCGNRGAFTDENGAYRVTKIPAGVHYVMVRKVTASGGGDDSDAVSGPADQFGSTESLPVSPEEIEVAIGPKTPNVVQNFVWVR